MSSATPSASASTSALARLLEPAGYSTADGIEPALQRALVDAGFAADAYALSPAMGGNTMVLFTYDTFTSLQAFLVDRAREVSPSTAVAPPAPQSSFMRWLTGNTGGGGSIPGWMILFGGGLVVLGGVAFAVSRRKR